MRVKLSEHAKELLKKADTRIEVVEMTPARREKFLRIFHKLDALMRAETETPIEGYMAVRFYQLFLEDHYGIAAAIVSDKGVTRA
jgi:hypothetical protein